MTARRGFQKGLPLSPRPRCHLPLQDRGTTLLGLPAQPTTLQLGVHSGATASLYPNRAVPLAARSQGVELV